MAGELRPHLGGVGLMAEQEAIDFRFLDDRTAAMVGDAGIVIAGSVSISRALAGRRSQPWRSWKLSPRHQISSASVAARIAVRSANVAIES